MEHLLKTQDSRSAATLNNSTQNPMINLFGCKLGFKCNTCIHFYIRVFGSNDFKCKLRADPDGPGHQANWTACSRHSRAIRQTSLDKAMRIKALYSKLKKFN